MTGETDRKDKNEARKIAIVLVSLVIVALVAAILFIPSLADVSAAWFEPGLGLKTSAIIAFCISLVVVLVFAVVSGEGIVGEIQFILPGFLIFFLIFWLMVAWIF